MTHFHVRMFFGRAALFCFALARSAQAQAWVQSQPHGTPPQGRINNTAVYDSVTQRLIIFGGFDTGTCCHGTNDVWVLTNSDSLGGPREWINLIPANAPGSPPPLAAASAVYDTHSNRMIVFGGEEPASGKSTNQVWILKNANGTGGPPSWTAVYAFGPPPRQNHQAVYDAATNRMIVVGGLSYLGGTPTPLGDAWVLTNANGSESTSPQWILLTPSGAAPSPRHGFAAAWNPFSNALTIFGGCTDSSFVCATDSDELWTLSNASGKDISGNTVTPAWTKLAYSGTAPSAHSQFGSTAYDLWNNQLFLFGGRVGQGAPFGSFTNMTWVLKNVNGLTGQAQWNTLTPGRSPAARGQSVPPNLFDAVGGHFIVFGGPGLNDTWTLRTSAGQN